eukprot:gene29199-32411_t
MKVVPNQLYITYNEGGLQEVSYDGAVTVITGGSPAAGTSADGSLSTATYTRLRGMYAYGDDVYLVDGSGTSSCLKTFGTSDVLSTITGNCNGGDSDFSSDLQGIDYDVGNDELHMAGTTVVYTFYGLRSGGDPGSMAGSQTESRLVDDTGTAARFNDLWGLAFTSDKVYVSEKSDHCIRVIDVFSRNVTTIAGKCGLSGAVDATGAIARFNSPHAVTYHGARGTILVADTGNNCIREINTFTCGVVTFAGTCGTAGSSADGIGAAAGFNSPVGIAYDYDNAVVYITELGNSCLRKIDSTLYVATLAVCGLVNPYFITVQQVIASP